MTKKSTETRWDAIYAALDWAQDEGGDASAQVQLLAEWRGMVDGRLEQAVEDMRLEGGSWADVGEMLGVTRQAAQQRYGKRW